MHSSKLLVRVMFGGLLMGLANLVPGISGGTMLLAAGIYPRFIEAVSDVTRLRFRLPSIFTLATVAAAAGLAILLFAGPMKNLVVSYRWVMYSLFIGLTLGGVPVVWRLTTGWSRPLVVSATVAFAMMVSLAVLQAFDVVGDFPSNALMLLFSGLAGASAMILPGLSGGYLLLLLGQYVPILSAIDEFKDALKAGDLGAILPVTVGVILPVGIGVVAGIAVVGNLLQWLLNHHRKATLGILLGLLIGSVAGLYPFCQPVAPQIGDRIKGQVVDAQNLDSFDQEDWKTEVFSPTPVQVLLSLLLTASGFALTMGVERIGGNDDESAASHDSPQKTPKI